MHLDDVILPLTVRFGGASAPETLSQTVVTTSGYRYSNALWSQKLRTLRLQWLLRNVGFAELRRDLGGGGDGTFLPGAGLGRLEQRPPVSHEGGQRGGGDGHGSAAAQHGDGPADRGRDDPDVSRWKNTMAPGPRATSGSFKSPEGTGVVAALDGTPTGRLHAMTTATGIVTFDGGAGGNAAVPTWGGAFFIPVAFTSDQGFSQSYEDAGCHGARHHPEGGAAVRSASAALQAHISPGRTRAWSTAGS